MDPKSVRKPYQYRLSPTPAQEQALDVVLWRCRTLYQVAREERQTAWERGGVSVSSSHQADELPGLKAACLEYGEVHSQVVPEVLKRLEKTQEAFFRRSREGQKPGFPRFQGRTRSNSCTYPPYGQGAVLDGGLLTLSKIGRIPMRVHRLLEGTPKTGTVRREAEGWYGCIWCAEVPTQPLPLPGQETGIDGGLKAFLVTADGVMVANPRQHRKAERYLAKWPRRGAGREKGGKRRAKAVKRLGTAHQTVRRQRQDCHHQSALSLVRQQDTIYVEDLPVANMTRRPHSTPDGQGGYQHNGAAVKAGLNSAIQDVGWDGFRLILACQAAWAGKRVVAVPPAFTTQECANILPQGTSCGTLVSKSLGMRTHSCPSCGFILDREVNAARNIPWAGQALQGVPALAGALH